MGFSPEFVIGYRTTLEVLHRIQSAEGEKRAFVSMLCQPSSSLRLLHNKVLSWEAGSFGLLNSKTRQSPSPKLNVSLQTHPRAHVTNPLS